MPTLRKRNSALLGTAAYVGSALAIATAATSLTSTPSQAANYFCVTPTPTLGLFLTISGQFATGVNGVACGQNASAASSNATAVGAGATATGAFSTAVGTGS